MSFLSFAQNFEDVMLWRCLKGQPPGHYIDVGAFHPEYDSCTKAFYDRGWSGINLEPVQSLFDLFVSRRKRDINLRCVAGSGNEDCVFFAVEGTGLSTTDESIAQLIRGRGFKVEEVVVCQTTITELVLKYNLAPLHFIKIDVEGSERNVLDGIDFDIVHPWLLIIEATAPSSQVASFASWEPRVLRGGYQFVYFDGLNRFYVSAEHADLARYFSHPPCVFDSFVRTTDNCLGLQLELLSELYGALHEVNHKLRTGYFSDFQAQNITRMSGDASLSQQVGNLEKALANYQKALSKQRMLLDRRTLSQDPLIEGGERG